MCPAADAREVQSVEQLLAGATDRQIIADSAGKSGAILERARIDGKPYVVKYIDRSRDWTMRAAGSLRGVSYELWLRGLFDDLPPCFLQPIVGVARGEMTVLLMEDVSEWLFPVTDAPISLADHLRVLDHMAALHATFWATTADIDVVPAMHRYLDLSPWTAEAEATLGDPPLVPQLIAKGWPLLAEVAPAASAVVAPLARDPGPLVEALDATPQTFIHGNFKLDNLGLTPDGRTVLLDWEISGIGACTADLAWYLSINCRRLPQSKEATIEAYRQFLERRGISTADWWDRQLGLALLGSLVQFGWEKALSGYDDELQWWEARALEGAMLL
jgi:hypothetical protein